MSRSTSEKATNAKMSSMRTLCSFVGQSFIVCSVSVKKKDSVDKTSDGVADLRASGIVILFRL
jgi:hypothetical protein